MPSLLVNIDVPDIDRGVAFYTQALGLHVGRRLGAGCMELLGAEVSVYLLKKARGLASARPAATRGDTKGTGRRSISTWS